MGMPHWSIELACSFWEDAGEDESFPRGLRRAIANALPLSVVLLPRLHVAAIDGWLQEQAVHGRLGFPDRPLRACLVARHGQGIIFLDGTDPDDEQRFSLAHECAHFLRGYWQPRRVAVDRLGPAVVEVLDGDRPVRQEERIHALLARVPLGFHVHLMDRTAEGRFASAAIDDAERDADLLAYELLAPSAFILARIGADSSSDQRVTIAAELTYRYGLPARVAARYATILVPRADRPDSLMHRLGLRA
ncbi:MAG TPA: ImmA/IrrE family metallo-endopeptidase [Chloroflexota bacterium]|nr:ImmA/IrrE family metallo-endopeptidase [Chloroflexota bacterium]